jgi:RNA binding exosome subunit
MEFPFRNAVVSTFAHATEDEQRVLSVLRTLLPEGVEVYRSKLEGHHGNPIINLEAKVGQRKLLRELWQRVLTKLRADEMKKLSKIVPERVDENCFFYLRFDKQLAHAGELVFTDSGDAIHFKLKVTTYPARRELAVNLLEKFIGVGSG